MVTKMRTVVLGGVAVVALAGCGVVGPQPSPIPTPLDRVVKIDHAKVPEGVVAYGSHRGSPAYGATVEDALKLRKPEDVSRMTGAPDDFKEFMRGTIQRDSKTIVAFLADKGQTLESKECEYAVEIRLWGVGPGVATGRVRGCEQNSFDAIWAKQDGTWRRVARMQGGWDCDVLARYRVPADITGSTCWYDDVKTRAYNGPG